MDDITYNFVEEVEIAIADIEMTNDLLELADREYILNEPDTAHLRDIYHASKTIVPIARERLKNNLDRFKNALNVFYNKLKEAATPPNRREQRGVIWKSLKLNLLYQQ